MDFQEYIKPELLILIPVLVAIGYGFKKAEWLAGQVHSGLPRSGRHSAVAPVGARWQHTV